MMKLLKDDLWARLKRCNLKINEGSNLTERLCQSYDMEYWWEISIGCIWNPRYLLHVRLRESPSVLVMKWKICFESELITQKKKKKKKKINSMVSIKENS